MTRTSLLRFLPAIGAAIVLVGCLGSWVSIDAGLASSSISGLDTDDGKILLGVAIVLIAGTLLASRRWMWIVLSIVALLALVIAVADLVDVGSEDVPTFGDVIQVSAGWGLWLCVLGGLVCLGATAWRTVAMPGRTPRVPEPIA